MAEYSAAGELDRLNPNSRQQQRPDLPSATLLSRAPSEQAQDFKKTSSFQITSVTVSSSVSNDGEDDSCGEVEDSQIEPPEPAEASPDSEEDFVEKPVSSTLIQEGAKLEDKEHSAALGPRFKVVRIDNEPFKRGRWLCVDYLDQPSHPKEELTDEVAVHHHHAATLQYPIQPPAPTLQGGAAVINTQQQSSIQVVAHSLPASAAAAVVAAAAAQYPQPPTPVVPIVSYPVSSVSSAVVVTSTNPVVTTPSLQQVVVPAPVPVAPPTFVPPVMPVVSQPVFTAPAQQQYVAPPSQQQVVPPPLVPAAAAAPPAAQLQPLTVLTQPSPSSAPQQPPPNSIPPPTQPGAPAPPLHPVVLPTVVVVPHPTGPAFDVIPPQQQQHIQQIPSNYQAPEVLIQQQPTGTVIHPAAQPHLSQPQLNPMAAPVFTTTTSSSSSSLPAPHPTPQPAVDPMGLGKAHGTAPTEDAAHGDQEHPSASGSSTVAIDNKIEQAMDLVKSHLMFAVREEVEVLKERIAELMDRIAFLETENGILRSAATQETLAQIAQLEATFPTASAVEPTATSAVALPPTTATSQPGNNNNNGTSPAP